MTVPLAVVVGTRAVAVIVAICPAPSVPIVHVNVLVPTAPVQVPTVLVGVAVNVKPDGRLSVTWTFVTAALVGFDTGMLNVRVPPAATGSGESDLVIVAPPPAAAPTVTTAVAQMLKAVPTTPACAQAWLVATAP